MTQRKVTVDSMGRAKITIPAHFRDKYNLKNHASVEVTDDGDHIIITPVK